jgi:hypothetical protein
MFGLKLPALAAAGAVAALAIGGVSGLPKQAIADEGGGGTDGSSSSSSSSSGSSSSSSDTGGSSMDISPQTVAPGGVVSLHLATSCKAGTKAKASADVFVDTVTLGPADDGRGMQGSALIKSDAIAGSYSISVQCDGVSASASASITVSSGSSTVPLSPLQPVEPVPAGGGGAAQQLAAGPAAAGTSTGPLLVTGGFAAAGLVGLVVYRRRTAARG